MAGDVAINGVGAPNYSGGFIGTPYGVFTIMTTPQGRVALNGNRPIIITRVLLYLAGYGADRSVGVYCADAGGSDYQSSGAFTVGAAGSAQSTGWRGLSKGFATSGPGVDMRVGFTNNNQITYFGRYEPVGGRDVIVDAPPNYIERPGASLAGYITYHEVPAAPAAPTLSAASSSSINASWPAPDNGGWGITGYTVHVDDDPNFGSPIGINVGGTSATITGLTPGTKYYVRVYARNGVSDAYGTFSAAGASSNITLGSAPAVPTGLTLAQGFGAVHASWSVPANNGSPITGYTLQWSADPAFTSSSTRDVTTNSESVEELVGALIPGATVYFRVRATNAIGSSAYSASSSITPPPRTRLNSVRAGAVHVPGGTQVRLSSDGAAGSPVITLEASDLLAGTATSYTIATIPTNAGAGTFATPGTDLDLALVTVPNGVVVIGRDASDSSKVLAKRYSRVGLSSSWSAGGTLSQALANTGDALAQFAAVYVPGTGGSPIDSVLVMVRRVGTLGAGNVSYATLNLANLAASSGALFIAYGNDPTWLAAPPSGQSPNSGRLDAASLAGLQRAVVAANGFGVVDVTNGVVAGVAKSADGSTYPYGRTRVLGINSTTFAVLTVTSAGALSVTFYGTNGSVLGTVTLAAATAWGGGFGTKWDAFYNAQSGQVSVYYVTDEDSRKVERVDVSPVTFNAAAAVVTTSTLGVAGAVHTDLRVPRGPVDERRLVLAGAYDNAGTLGASAYDDRSGNKAPNTPSLSARANYDATQAASFTWAFSDPNASDAQTAFELEVQRVSDSVTVHSTGKVTSSTPSRTVAGGTLTNGVAYRWRVRTYDALDVVGAWSAYSTFSTSTLGTLTITSPAADGTTPDVADYTFTWTYAQANGYTQAQRRVRLTRTDTNAVVLDTTMQASTALSYLVTGMQSDVPYRFDLDIINTNAQTVSASRTILPSFNSPVAPIVSATPGENYLELEVINPAPTGSRPDALGNIIERRSAGSSEAWQTVATVNRNATYLDREVASGASYDYRATAYAGEYTTTGGLETATAPTLFGAWLHALADPAGTEGNYAYQVGERAERIEVAAVPLALIGRTFASVEFGEPERHELALKVKVPWSEEHDVEVERMRGYKRGRATLCYRDNRGRLMYAAIVEPLGITDSVDAGSEIELVLTRVER